jgi:hypothetical protein
MQLVFTKNEEHPMKNSNQFTNKKLIKEGFECLRKIEALLNSVDNRLAMKSQKAA